MVIKEMSSSLLCQTRYKLNAKELGWITVSFYMVKREKGEKNYFCTFPHVVVDVKATTRPKRKTSSNLDWKQ